MKNTIKHLFLVISILTFWLNHHVLAAENLPKLPAYGVDINQTSVSGLSSGAFMATQFHVAFSKTIVGAGVVAGGPYYCARGGPATPQITAMTTCMNSCLGFEYGGVCWNPVATYPNSNRLVESAKQFAAQGKIDDLSHLKNDKLYIFTGENDYLVNTKVVEQTKEFYLLTGVPQTNIFYQHDIDSGHAIITNNDQDLVCESTLSPYINNCGFIQSHEILNRIYDSLNPPTTTSLSGKIIEFSQHEFVEPNTHIGMSETAYAYVPKSCETQTCRVHVAFHGCEQGACAIGNSFYTKTGYNQLAETNNIIVLYPQITASTLEPLNPLGCWDFWGYSGSDFYTQAAPQMATVMKMLERLAKPRIKSLK